MVRTESGILATEPTKLCVLARDQTSVALLNSVAAVMPACPDVFGVRKVSSSPTQLPDVDAQRAVLT